MPVGDIAGEALGGIVRFIGRLFVELVFELLIQGTGHVVLKTLRPHREPGDTESALVGLLVWAAVAAGGFWLYHHAAAA
jgi:hypothetical protein